MRAIHLAFVISTIAGALLAPALDAAQRAETPPVIPAGATAIEGTPSIKIETTGDGTTRREVLGNAPISNGALKIEIVDGRYYRVGGDRRPFTLSRAGEFIYLTSNEPGHYIRFSEINGRLRYVEHVDVEFGSVTYWGELRFVLGRPTR